MLFALREFKEFAFYRHDVVVNQKYGTDDELPYSFHLKMVESQLWRFQDLVEVQEFNLARVGAWGHDLIEDARLSYHDIKNAWGMDVADVIWGCTDSEGRNRGERHDEKYWARLTSNKISVFVKLCDRIANMLYSLSVNSNMYDRYKREWPEMRSRLHDYETEFKDIFVFIEKLQNF